MDWWHICEANRNRPLFFHFLLYIGFTMSELALQRISENKRTKIPFLDLGNCRLTELPPDISKCTWLKTLHLNDNRELSNLSPLNDLKNLQILYISSTQVDDLSPLKNLQYLQLLNVSYTRVADLSPLKGLQNLQLLNISSTQVADLSPLKDLQNLQQINVFSTQTADLSPLKDLQKLQLLYASSTHVADLSPLKDLENLQVLDISYTRVADLFPILPLIKKGKQVEWNMYSGDINVKNCPLVTPPLEIVQQGNAAILSYFEQLEKKDFDQIYEAKLLLIGEGGAGKTTLYRKLFDPTAELPREEDSTRGIDIRPLYFDMSDGKQFRLNIWDFAGQGKYQSAHSFFYTHRSLYVLVDDTRTLDENDAYRTYYHYWLQTAKLFGGNSPLLVLHNQKSDRARTGFNLGVFQTDFPFVKELFCINLGGSDTTSILDLKKQIERWAQKLPHIDRKSVV